MKTKMSKVALEAQREYKRRWRAANRDKTRLANVRYWEKKARELSEEQKAEIVERLFRASDFSTLEPLAVERIAGLLGISADELRARFCIWRKAHPEVVYPEQLFED